VCVARFHTTNTPKTSNDRSHRGELKKVGPVDFCVCHPEIKLILYLENHQFGPRAVRIRPNFLKKILGGRTDPYGPGKVNVDQILTSLTKDLKIANLNR